MKKILFALTAMLLLTYLGQAQDCKFRTDKVDPISGKKTQGISLKTTLKMAVGLARSGDDYYLESYAYMGGEQNFELPEGSLLDLKLGNDVVLSLPSNVSVKPVTTVNGSATASVSTSYLVKYKISKEQAEQIKANGIKYLRMHLNGDQGYDLEFKEKDMEKSIRSAKCIFQ